MLSMLLRYSAIILALVSTARGATDFEWPGQGVVSFTVPPKWTLEGVPVSGSQFELRARVESRNAALMQISLMESASDNPVLADKLVDLLRRSTAAIVDTSVEKRFQPRGMLLAQGQGYWVQFTDASLVGKPPVPGDYKMMRNAMIALDDHAFVVATMQFDNPASDEPAAMLGILSSMRFRREGSTDETSTADPDAPLEFTVPESKLRLVLALEGLDRRSFRGDVKSGGSGYFIVTRINPIPEPS
jgi:hypothetical protein